MMTSTAMISWLLLRTRGTLRIDIMNPSENALEKLPEDYEMPT